MNFLITIKLLPNCSNSPLSSLQILGIISLGPNLSKNIILLLSNSKHTVHYFKVQTLFYYKLKMDFNMIIIVINLY